MNEKRETRLIGFVGIDKYDIICYLARVLQKLKKRVLLVDASEEMALTESIPEPKRSEKPDDAADFKAVMEYRGIHYLNYGSYNSFVIEALAQQYREDGFYDCVLIDFGFRTNHNLVTQCDIMIGVTDQRIHNVRRLSLLPDTQGQKKVLLLRDYCSSGIPEKVILRTLRYQKSECEVLYLYLNERDTALKLTSRYPGLATFRSISAEGKATMKRLLLLLFPKVGGMELTRAYRAAARG